MHSAPNASKRVLPGNPWQWPAISSTKSGFDCFFLFRLAKGTAPFQDKCFTAPAGNASVLPKLASGIYKTSQLPEHHVKYLTPPRQTCYGAVADKSARPRTFQSQSTKATRRSSAARSGPEACAALWFLANFNWWSDGGSRVVDDGQGGHEVGITPAQVAKVIDCLQDRFVRSEASLDVVSFSTSLLIAKLLSGLRRG
jgi:hypothetical protein